MTLPPDAQTPRTLKIVSVSADDLRWATQWLKAHDGLVWEGLAELHAELTAERERGRRVREETIEKCAKIAEELKITTEWCEGSPRTYRMAMPVETAEAIRALSRAESAPADVPTGERDD